MSFDDWLLSLHVLSAFAMVAAIVVFWVVIVAVRGTDEPEATLRTGLLMKVGNVAVGIGSVGTIAFGIWLAIALNAYEVWNGWVIAAVVLWVIGVGTGERAGAAYRPGAEKAAELETAGQTGPSEELLALNRTSTGLLMAAVSTVAVVLILVDMIWKPGA